MTDSEINRLNTDDALSKDNHQSSKSKKTKSNPDKNKKKSGRSRMWALKITLVTFCIALFFSFISEITSSKAGLVLSCFLLVLLVLISIIFDGIGVAVTSCDIVALNSMAANKVSGAKTAIRLVKNAEKVQNICSDVIGDICGIISGGCSIGIIAKIIELASLQGTWVLVLTIAMSSIVCAITVGGKAYLKEYAIKNNVDMVMLAARFLNVFVKNKNK